MPTIRRSESIGYYLDVEIVDAQFIPTTETTIVEEDALILSIIITNEGGQATPIFTIQDKQPTPKVFVFGKDREVTVGSETSFSHTKGLLATGGLTWKCDTANALVGRIEYIRP